MYGWPVCWLMFPWRVVYSISASAPLFLSAPASCSFSAIFVFNILISSSSVKTFPQPEEGSCSTFVMCAWTSAIAKFLSVVHAVEELAWLDPQQQRERHERFAHPRRVASGLPVAVRPVADSCGFCESCLGQSLPMS